MRWGKEMKIYSVNNTVDKNGVMVNPCVSQCTPTASGEACALTLYDL